MRVSIIFIMVVTAMMLTFNVSAQRTEPERKAEKPIQPTQISGTEKEDVSATKDADAPPETQVKEPSTQDVNAAENRLTAIHSQMVLKVVNPDDARVKLKELVQSMGGYATHITDNSIILKVPPQKLNTAIDEFVKQGILVEKTIEREDLTLQIAQLEGKLNSQNEILQKLKGFFDDSDFAATLDIERSMAQLVMEIEFVKGQLRMLYDQAEWSVIEVHFRFREREKVIYVSSPFEWLNSANLSTFLEEF